jgi:GNAT superfamily N-acetyltransferase
MEPHTEGLEKYNSPSITAGSVEDIQLLPKDLKVQRDEQEVASPDEFQIEVGPLEFDYEPIKEKVEKGESSLRIVKDGSGNIIGFTVLSPGANQEHSINMLWVDPEQRKSGLGSKLLEDAVAQLPDGQISMDIWGGEPMTKLAEKYGFNQNAGGEMTNRYSLTKQSTTS